MIVKMINVSVERQTILRIIRVIRKLRLFDLLKDSHLGNVQ